jgi:hypothetical protein
MGNSLLLILKKPAEFQKQAWNEELIQDTGGRRDDRMKKRCSTQLLPSHVAASEYF